ncbi:hypothetical protein [Microscilla marina]|uniref:Uncharacterized protein n=1 Tax=Microscilla marina ATCC 23134 TaxID=313606 RepID=A1ZNW2_MICM2|nr:hypothetical protein [Microscilla marina]EAY28001.1 hypothetical protein M23134_02670 [Microscilla marina ATCC 23134]
MGENKVASETLSIGVVGFSRNQFDKKTAAEKLEKIITQIIANHPNKNYELVSGFTNMGVPQLAYVLADRLGMDTVGFSASQAFRVRAGVYPVKKQIIVGEKFGDESNAFVQYIDSLVRIGGGPQSRHEVTLFKKLHAGKDLSQRLYEEEVEWYGK